MKLLSLVALLLANLCLVRAQGSWAGDPIVREDEEQDPFSGVEFGGMN